ncbi:MULTISPECIES: glutathione transferase GstA [Rhodopseudomonas]|uniref:Glutathione S-transferase n=1 Tax=Rhodopseudomonas palustris TaxID=1076 RepID=A0A0D7EXD6_RHOPL|nr:MULTISPECIES: glutathione transferase GstA [Rhodopseudomonas]KIZ45276.1 glutathione S-transferase [Rhodopseudomonas palustris]MDF3811006.1 glutathione transferase GstA [Rhodopseudomonas sp. BAL398]WOK15904.1 glutathione transferase GstA [Rhodopseudomonas sp. BAL398]
MKLYHEVRGCSLAVDIVRRELGIPLELIWVDVPRKLLPDGSDYYAINPKGQVPALELADGQFLTEGAVIMQYLADQCPESELCAPAGTLERYRIMEWMSFIASDLHKGGFMPLLKKVTPDDYRPIARQLVISRLKWLNDHLATQDYLTGATFTIADAHCYTIAMWTEFQHIDISPWPHLQAYLKRIGARPSVVAAKEAERQEAERASATA